MSSSSTTFDITLSNVINITPSELKDMVAQHPISWKNTRWHTDSREYLQYLEGLMNSKKSIDPIIFIQKLQDALRSKAQRGSNTSRNYGPLLTKLQNTIPSEIWQQISEEKKLDADSYGRILNHYWNEKEAHHNSLLRECKKITDGFTLAKKKPHPAEQFLMKECGMLIDELKPIAQQINQLAQDLKNQEEKFDQEIHSLNATLEERRKSDKCLDTYLKQNKRYKDYQERIRYWKEWKELGPNSTKTQLIPEYESEVRYQGTRKDVVARMFGDYVWKIIDEERKLKDAKRNAYRANPEIKQIEERIAQLPREKQALLKFIRQRKTSIEQEHNNRNQNLQNYQSQLKTIRAAFADLLSRESAFRHQQDLLVFPKIHENTGHAIANYDLQVQICKREIKTNQQYLLKVHDIDINIVAIERPPALAPHPVIVPSTPKENMLQQEGQPRLIEEIKSIPMTSSEGIPLRREGVLENNSPQIEEQSRLIEEFKSIPITSSEGIPLRIDDNKQPGSMDAVTPAQASQLYDEQPGLSSSTISSIQINAPLSQHMDTPIPAQISQRGDDDQPGLPNPTVSNNQINASLSHHTEVNQLSNPSVSNPPTKKLAEANDATVPPSVLSNISTTPGVSSVNNSNAMWYSGLGKSSSSERLEEGSNYNQDEPTKKVMYGT